MSFSLYRCGDDTYVVVPESMSPPIEAIRAHGDSIFIGADPRRMLDSAAWDRVSAEIGQKLYAVVAAEELEDMFVTS